MPIERKLIAHRAMEDTCPRAQFAHGQVWLLGLGNPTR